MDLRGHRTDTVRPGHFEYRKSVRINGGYDSSRVDGDQAAGYVSDQALTEPLGSIGALSLYLMKLGELSLVGLELFDQGLKCLSNKLSLADCRRCAHRTPARSLNHPAVRSQQPSNQHKDETDPQDQRENLIAEQVDDDRRGPELAAAAGE